MDLGIVRMAVAEQLVAMSMRVRLAGRGGNRKQRLAGGSADSKERRSTERKRYGQAVTALPTVRRHGRSLSLILAPDY
jgi:hypothetical protein